jgi:hypothetical protein
MFNSMQDQISIMTKWVRYLDNMIEMIVIHDLGIMIA